MSKRIVPLLAAACLAVIAGGAEAVDVRAGVLRVDYPALLPISRYDLRPDDLAFLDVTGRVARTLLDLCKEPDAMTHPDGMQIKITRQEIGRIVGCSREMVGRVLKTLEDQGLVRVKGKTMVVYGTR